jgi:hypothetical protein
MQRTGRGAAGGVSRRLQPAVGAGGEQQRWRGGVGDGHDELKTMRRWVAAHMLFS